MKSQCVFFIKKYFQMKYNFNTVFFEIQSCSVLVYLF